jgi:hypothetical protein
MGTGYTRQDSTDNISNGNVINASDLDNEFDALDAAFGEVNGHTHDGTANEGGPITTVGPAQDVIVSATGVIPKTDNTLDLGSALKTFKDGYFTNEVTAGSFVGDVVGTASGLTTGRTISLTGDATGSTSFDGSSDVSITVAVTDDSHTHDGRYYTETEVDSLITGVEDRVVPVTTGGTGGTTASEARTNLGLGSLAVQNTIGDADYAGSPLSQANGGTGATSLGAGTVTPTGGTTARSLADLFSDTVNVKDYGATGDGTTDDKSAIEAAISAATTSGGIVYLPPGVYYVSGAVSIPDEVHLFGAGDYATEVKSTGDYAVFSMVGASDNPINQGGVSDMLIRGGGKTNTSAYGVYMQWTNRCTLARLRFFSCRIAVYQQHAFQNEWSLLSADGAGSDQNYIGFYFAETTSVYIDNAAIADRCLAQNCEFAGWRIINGNGSTISNCQGFGNAAGDCQYGWYIGDPPSGTLESEWVHFTNCLGDSCIQNWRISKGNATLLGNLQFHGVWSGNSSDAAVTNGSGLLIIGLTNTVFTGVHVESVAEYGIFLDDCSDLTFTGFYISEFDREDDDNAGIAVQDTQDCVFCGGHINADLVASASAPAILEVNDTGTTQNNTYVAINSDRSYTFSASAKHALLRSGSGNLAPNLQLPSSASGLNAGQMWSDSGTVKVVT